MLQFLILLTSVIITVTVATGAYSTYGKVSDLKQETAMHKEKIHNFKNNYDIDVAQTADKVNDTMRRMKRVYNEVDKDVETSDKIFGMEFGKRGKLLQKKIINNRDYTNMKKDDINHTRVYVNSVIRDHSKAVSDEINRRWGTHKNSEKTLKDIGYDKSSNTYALNDFVAVNGKKHMKLSELYKQASMLTDSINNELIDKFQKNFGEIDLMNSSFNTTTIENRQKLTDISGNVDDFEKNLKTKITTEMQDVGRELGEYEQAALKDYTTKITDFVIDNVEQHRDVNKKNIIVNSNEEMTKISQSIEKQVNTQVAEFTTDLDSKKGEFKLKKKGIEEKLAEINKNIDSKMVKLKISVDDKAKKVTEQQREIAELKKSLADFIKKEDVVAEMKNNAAVGTKLLNELKDYSGVVKAVDMRIDNSSKSVKNIAADLALIERAYNSVTGKEYVNIEKNRINMVGTESIKFSPQLGIHMTQAGGGSKLSIGSLDQNNTSAIVSFDRPIETNGTIIDGASINSSFSSVEDSKTGFVTKSAFGDMKGLKAKGSTAGGHTHDFVKISDVNEYASQISKKKDVPVDVNKIKNGSIPVTSMMTLPHSKIDFANSGVIVSGGATDFKADRTHTKTLQNIAWIEAGANSIPASTIDWSGLSLSEIDSSISGSSVNASSLAHGIIPVTKINKAGIFTTSNASVASATLSGNIALNNVNIKDVDTFNIKDLTI